MERAEALKQLKRLEGRNLHDLAKEYGITIVAANGKVNKGWAGHTLERYLGLPMNSAQSPNFGSWELKGIPLNYRKDGRLRFKETMAITMIDPYHVAHTSFENSHLLAKLRKIVCVARLVGKSYGEPTYIHQVVTMDITKNAVLYEQVKSDHSLVQECLHDPLRGFSALTGRMGVYIQPRTKGAGHGSTSRAFYARPCFLAQFIMLDT